VVVRVCDPPCAAVPCYLSTFDAGEASLLVADCGSHRVLLLNSELELVRVFLDEEHDGVARPRRVVKSGCFLVGHSNCESADDNNNDAVVSLFWPCRSELQPLPDSPTSVEMF